MQTSSDAEANAMLMRAGNVSKTMSPLIGGRQSRHNNNNNNNNNNCNNHNSNDNNNNNNNNDFLTFKDKIHNIQIYRLDPAGLDRCS